MLVLNISIVLQSNPANRSAVAFVRQTDANNNTHLHFQYSTNKIYITYTHMSNFLDVSTKVKMMISHHD